MLVFGLLVSGTIMNIIIQSLGDNKKGQSGDQRRRKARAPAKLHDVQIAVQGLDSFTTKILLPEFSN